MKNCCVFLYLLVNNITVFAQEKWTLEQCVKYAVANNITLQQSAINAKLSALQIQQTKYSQYPNLNTDINNGLSVGRSIDPTSNTFINQGYYFNGFNIASNVLLFGWFSKKYQRQQSEYDYKASEQQYLQLQNDITLNIATGYLRILLAKEQIKINEAQLQTDLEQYTFTRKRANAGQLPALNVAQLATQVANDSSLLIGSELDVNAALLDLKSILNLEMNTPFDVAEVQNLASQIVAINVYPTPQQIFEIAKTKRPSIEANAYKIKSATKQLAVAKSALYPSVNIGGNIGTNFASTVRSITGTTYKGEEFLGNIKIADSNFAVTRPAYNFETATVPLLKQFSNNIRQTLSLGISLPIFNGYTSKLNIERAKLNIASAGLAMQQEVNSLQQNVFKAYNDAQAAVQKYTAAKNTENASSIALDYTIKRYNAGLLNTQEYTVQQNTLSRAKINTVLVLYDAIFKMKILDFYLGKEINMNN